METYLQFNPASTIRVEEQVSVVDNRAFLRHIPKKGSVVIDGFTEVDGAPQAKQFYCDYATDSLYRDANRVLHFNAVNNNQTITVNYIAIGTVVTADDMNEIKAHLENDSIHGAPYDLPTMGESIKGGAKIDYRSNLLVDPKNYLRCFSQFNFFSYRLTNWDDRAVFDQALEYLEANGYVPSRGHSEVEFHRAIEEWFADCTSALSHESGWYRPSQIGDIFTIVSNPTTYMTVYYCQRTVGNNSPNVWQLLTSSNHTAWNFYLPILTAKDRKLLDYLHDQLDDQLD